MYRLLAGLIAVVAASASPTLPLYFEPNRGQAHARVEFLSRGNGVTSYLGRDAAAFTVGGSSIVMRLAGAKPAGGEGRERLPGHSAYFAQSARTTWHTGIPQFNKVIYRGVYPGIDLVYYGSRGTLEYDFQIAPGADPSAIQIIYQGAAHLRIENGDLLLTTAGGEIRQRRPVVYQDLGSSRRTVEASYQLNGNRMGFRIANYDRHFPLVVDPVIEYATYFGGAGMDTANDVKVDSAGNIYIAGSVATPATAADPFIPASRSSYNSTAAVIKYSQSQKAILYVAQLGSDGQNIAVRLDVDSAGALYLTGTTNSTSFPVVSGVDQANRAGSFTPFVAKIASDGQTLAFSTYFGGTGLDQYGGIAAGPNGSAYVTGTAAARDFPVTDKSVNTNDGPKAYLAKFNGDGSLAFSRLFGGAGSNAGNGIALDGNGNIYITGATSSTNFPVMNAFQSISRKDPTFGTLLGLRSAFAAKFTSDGKTLVYSTLVGGSGDDDATSAAVDGQGNLYLAGSTTSIDLPVLNATQQGLSGLQNGFVAELNPQGNQLVFLTYLGGSQKDVVQGVALDAAGNIYVAGSTNSIDFPVLNPIQTTPAKKSANAHNAFAAKFAPGGQGIIFSTIFGGSNDDHANGVAPDSSGAAYIVGDTNSPDLPVSNAFQASFGGAWDMFLAKITPDATPSSPITVLPASLNFTMVTGGAAPTAQALNVTPSAGGAAGNFTAMASTSNGGNWLSITPSAGTAPGQIAVSVNPAGLALGIYSGTIQVAAASGTAIVAPVTLRVIPVTPVLTSVTPAEFDVAHFDSLNPPSTLPTVTLTISGTGFVSGATAWVTAFIPQNTQSYPTTLIDSNTLQVALPLSLQPGPITLTVTNPGTPQSNALSLLEGKPAISASGVTGVVAPGQTVAINGFNLGPLVPMAASASGPGVTTLGPTQVLFDGVPAQVLFSYFMQVRVVVPAGVAGETATKIVVKYLDQSSQPLTVPTAGNQAPPPQLGPGVSGVLNPDGSVNSASNPASAGAVVTVLIDNSQVPGKNMPATVTIGGVNAPIVPMTGFIIGVPGKLMFQVQIPAGVQPGSAVPLAVAFQNTSATVSVPIAIQ